MNNKQENFKTILICSNYAWTIFNFRLPLIRQLKKEGFKVILVTQFDGYETNLEKEVDFIYKLFISRKGINIFQDLFTFFNLIYILRKTKPDLCLWYTIKPVIYGTFAASFLKIISIPTITGLGTTFLKKNWITTLVKKLYKISFYRINTVIFQNSADRDLFIENKIIEFDRCEISPGSGININNFKPKNLPETENFKFLLVARMIKDKGIVEFIDAARIVKKKIPSTKFFLLGPLGIENRTAIDKKEIEKWVKEGIVDYLGKTDNVNSYISDSNCVVLPSYREGTSRVLLEASALERPIIATDVPGCREIIDNFKNGILCKPKNSIDLADAMIKITKFSRDELEKMGRNGRNKVLDEFDLEIVLNLYMKLIRLNLNFNL